jgi:hypothetical protein
MKLYTDLNIPLWNWIQIQESYSKGEPDLSYLAEKRPKKYNKKKFYDAYLKILYQIPKMDLSLNKKWTEFVIEQKKWEVSREMNAWKRMFGKKQSPVKTYNLNKTFDEYLKELEEHNKGFKFTVYGLKKNFKELWDYDKSIPKQLRKNEEFQFLLVEEYFELINNFIKDGMDIEYATILFSKEFFTKFIDSKEITVKSLSKINTRLFEHFRDTNNIDKWYIIRGDLFSIYKLDFEVKDNTEVIDQVIRLRKINNQGIPLKGVNATTLKEFFRQIEVAKQMQPKKDGEQVSI